MVKKEWFPFEALTDPDFQCIEDIEDEGPSEEDLEYARLAELVDGVKAGDAGTAEVLACEIYQASITRLAREALISELAKKSKISASVIKKCVNAALDLKLEDDDALMAKLAGYNNRYAFIKGMAKPVLDEALMRRRGQVVMLTDKSFTADNAADKHEVESAEGKTLTAVSKLWWEWTDRRSYEGIAFEPDSKDKKIYNLFRGFKVNARKSGSWDTLQDHMLHNICGENDLYMDWLMTWMAHAVQCPGEKPGSAVVLIGRKGTGKSMLFSWFGKLMAPYYFTTSQSRHVTGNFNAHMLAKLFIHLDEGFFAGDGQSNSALKTLITEHKMPIEFKGVDTEMISNYSRVGITSNETWVVPATLEDERRFFCLQVGERNIQDFEFFGKLVDEMKHGGLERMMYDLKHWEVPKSIGGSWNALRRPPETNALIRQALAGLPPYERFFINMIQNGGLDEHPFNDHLERVELKPDTFTFVPKRLIQAHYNDCLRHSPTAKGKNAANDHEAFEESLAKFLSPESSKRNRFMFVKDADKIGYTNSPFKRSSDGKLDCYKIPSLETLRRRLEEVHKIKTDAAR